MKTNYTWSKTTDNASEIFGTFAGANTVAFSQDPVDYKKAEHGISGLDFPQTWTVSFNENIPVFQSQKGIVGHVLGGWSVAGSYILQSGQPYNPTEFFFAYLLSPYDTRDGSFLNSFNSGSDTARPFLEQSFGSSYGDGDLRRRRVRTLRGPGQLRGAPNSLVDFTALNGTGSTSVVDPKQVHFIVNTYEAQVINGTPYGNAGRNSVRDYHTNTANFQLAKTSNWGERVRLSGT